MTYITTGSSIPTQGGNNGKYLTTNGNTTSWGTVSGSGDMLLASTQTVSGLKTFLTGMFGLRNVANTFTSFFTNTNTADRTYTLKDANGTLAFTSDITGTNSGTNTGDNSVNSLYSGLGASKLDTNGNGSSLTGLTKTQVGLSNVDDTTDLGKPVSTATTTALNLKQNTLVSNTNIKTVGGISLLGSGDISILVDLNQNNTIASINQSLTANYNSIISRKYKINSGIKLTINNGAILRIL